MGFQNISSVLDFSSTGTISTTGAVSSNSLNTSTLSIGLRSGGSWTEKMRVNGTTGNITTDGTITATGSISSSYLRTDQLSVGQPSGSVWLEKMWVDGTTGNITTNGAMTTNTLTTSGTSLNIKSDIVRFRGLDDTVYIEADTGGVKFYDGVFMNSYLQIQNGLSLGSLTGGTWTDRVGISSSTGNMSTNGSITAT